MFENYSCQSGLFESYLRVSLSKIQHLSKNIEKSTSNNKSL